MVAVVTVIFGAPNIFSRFDDRKRPLSATRNTIIENTVFENNTTYGCATGPSGSNDFIARVRTLFQIAGEVLSFMGFLDRSILFFVRATFTRSFERYARTRAIKSLVPDGPVTH